MTIRTRTSLHGISPRTPSSQNISSQSPANFRNSVRKSTVSARFLKKLFSVKTRSGAAAVAASLMIGAPLSADDLEVFTAGITETVKPNILLVLDYSGSMLQDVDGNRVADGNEDEAKINILREAVAAVLAEGKDLFNIGVGPLYTRTSGGVQWPISAVDADANDIDANIPAGQFTSEDVINSLLEERLAGGATATVAALAEAGMYFRGGNVYSGGADPDHTTQFVPHNWDTAIDAYADGFYLAPNPATYTPSDAYQVNANHPDSYSLCSDFSASGRTNFCAGRQTYDCEFVAPGERYNVNIGEASRFARNVCKSPHPDRWTGANYNSPIVDECQDNFIILISDGQPTAEGNFDAIEEITGIGADACEDLSQSIFSDSNPDTATAGNCGYEVVRELAGKTQNPAIPESFVKTYAVGFSIDGAGGEYLDGLATAGEGKFFEANKPEELVAALREILNDILPDSESFAEVSVDINKASFSSDDRVYFPLFKPGFENSWQGNIKGYFVDAEGIKDVRGNPATTDSDIGTVFAETSQSFWSDDVDGNETLEGGLSGRLDPANRNLYTFTGNRIPRGGVALNSIAGANDLHVDNEDVDYGQLQIPTDANNRAELLDWIAQQPIGAPLHSKLQVINYAGGQRVVYAITNQGFLHAFDVSRPGKGGTNDLAGGEELYAFMPKELLPNLEAMRTGVSTESHIYGLDGNITRWHDDTNNDGVVNNGEDVLLIFGMRRGGNQYYAIDVTSPENPVLKWQITGGQGQFKDLAQSWSRASLVQVKRSSGEEQVLVFGGGYDPILDDRDQRHPSSGNSVFMVDRDGNFIWSATHPQMNYAIPSDITVIDSDSDAIADRMYFGDLGGQVWRVDIDNVDRPNDFSIHRLADVSTAGYQPFFYAPSVAYNDQAGQAYLSVALGSGNRDNPLDANSRNEFYVFKDENVQKGPLPASAQTIRHGQLHDATNNFIASDTPSIAQAAKEDLRTAPGWRIELQAGEKSLSQTIIFNGRLLATTFQPGNAAANTCGTPGSTGRFYMIDVISGEPVDHLGNADTNEPLNASHRSTVISGSGIPTSPVIIFPEGELSAQVLVDKAVVGGIDSRIKRVYWFAEQ